MDSYELELWDRQTDILLSNNYTTDEINDRDFYTRHQMIRNNCEGCVGDFYNKVGNGWGEEL